MRGSGFDTLAGLGLLAFGAVLVLSIVVLWPREWRWALGAMVLLEDWVDEPSRRGNVTGMQRFLAETLDANWLTNKAKIDGMLVLFQWAAVALGAEVVFWTLKLA